MGKVNGITVNLITYFLMKTKGRKAILGIQLS